MDQAKHGLQKRLSGLAWAIGEGVAASKSHERVLTNDELVTIQAGCDNFLAPSLEGRAVRRPVIDPTSLLLKSARPVTVAARAPAGRIALNARSAGSNLAREVPSLRRS
jgi:hypothetical protein